jgi:hypothetical protein
MHVTRRLLLGSSAIALAALVGCDSSPSSASTGRSQVLSPSPTDDTPPASAPTLTDVAFLHHSVGSNLIEQGDLRGLLRQRGYRLWDQGYNGDGLRGPDGTRAPYGYDIPGDNTDVDGLAAIFSQPVDDASLRSDGRPVNALSGLLRHQIVVFKSCYVVTPIASDAQLGQYRRWYLEIRSTIERWPGRLFIALTPPPLEPGSTNPDMAGRARAFANWMRSPEFVGGHSNLFVFDLFDLLAEPDPTRWDYNTLRESCRSEQHDLRFQVKRALASVAAAARVGSRWADVAVGADSHPNYFANQTIAPLFANAIDRAARFFAQRLVSA